MSAFDNTSPFQVLQRSISHHQPGGALEERKPATQNDDKLDKEELMNRRQSFRLMRRNTLTVESHVLAATFATYTKSLLISFSTHYICSKPRMPANAGLLLELLQSVYYALFNGKT